MQVKQSESADLFAMMTAEEVDQPVGGRDIGSNGVRRAAAIVGEMPRPARREGARRMLFPF
jgi:hypothetical protein